MKNKLKFLSSAAFTVLLAGLAVAGANAQSNEQSQSTHQANQTEKSGKAGTRNDGARDGDQSSARKDVRPERSRAQHRER